MCKYITYQEHYFVQDWNKNQQYTTSFNQYWNKKWDTT